MKKKKSNTAKKKGIQSVFFPILGFIKQPFAWMNGNVWVWGICVFS